MVDTIQNVTKCFCQEMREKGHACARWQSGSCFPTNKLHFFKFFLMDSLDQISLRITKQGFE